MAEGTGARGHLIAALEADLIGPYEGAEAFAISTERLRIPPSRWYLTGFLAAMEAREVADPPDDGAVAGSDTDAEEGASTEEAPERRHLLPASIGLSVLVPAARAGEPDTVVATVRWADFLPEEVEPEEGAPRESLETEITESPRPLPIRGATTCSTRSPTYCSRRSRSTAATRLRRFAKGSTARRTRTKCRWPAFSSRPAPQEPKGLLEVWSKKAAA